ncbi:MAG: putative electron transport protein YccM [Syntrophorhabdus sp. PtaB.Bin184]|nr:MAG: putative electron transport protein YccM [Syntrophorhabdus sp. PtaB.Bin184]
MKTKTGTLWAFFKSVILTLPMMFLTLLMLTRGSLPSDPAQGIALLGTFLFLNTIFFLMVFTGKTDRYRAVLFVAYSVAFVISFTSHLIDVRGSMAISQANRIEGDVPFCHIAIPMTILPAALTKTIIFPGTIVGSYASVASMFVLWIGMSLALGRGFCSWFCFFGGIEEGFSRVLKKPILRNITTRWTYLPYAVLLVVVLLAAATLSPTYCAWLCPFKAVTEFAAITSFKTLVQTAIFVSLFLGLVVILPILTKKRTQCTLLCPLGALQSITNKANPFQVRVKAEACKGCMTCTRVCPTLSINRESIAKGGTRTSCTKCGKCVDACPEKALFYHVKGTCLSNRIGRYRLLFIYPAFLVLAIMSGRYLEGAIAKAVTLIMGLGVR